MKGLIFILVFQVAFFFSSVHAERIDMERFSNIDLSKTEAREVKDDRSEWWREAKFGMFIHWGVYAVAEGEWKGKVTGSYSEWLMYNEQIPIAEYEKLAAQFNPIKFDAEKWVGLAKQAGMKYMVITSKHHDGFAMFDSKVNNYDITDATGFGRDPIDELAKACKKAGIKFGCYYSVDRDWHHPDAQGNDLNQTNFWDYPDESKRDFDKYLYESALPQVEEVLIKYDPAIIWFDGIGKKTKEQNEQILRMARSLRPDCLVNSRLGEWKKYVWGDYRSMGDNRVSNRDLGYGWENPGTINSTYGYSRHDREWKSHTEIIRMLVDIASNGGNYLLNIGPTAEGTIPPESVRVLQEVGKWMDKFGESVYETSCGIIDKPKWGRSTSKGDEVYLHVFDWPSNDKIAVSGLNRQVHGAYLLGDAERKKLRVVNCGQNNIIIELNTIEMDPKAVDSSDTVIVIETSVNSN